MTASAPGRPAEPAIATTDEPWLVIIDPQTIFASPDSAWGSPMFAATIGVVRDLAGPRRSRTLLTRWLPAPASDRTGSWRTYFARWPFADRDPTDPMYALDPRAADLTDRASIDATTFGKWPALETITGAAPHLWLTGVATDCCVISTALAAADAGATLTVIADACAGSTSRAHEAALHVMGLYAPQITVTTSSDLA